ncbi:MAG: periplasmic heavy metal sensor [Dinghuibacter sp.]|nr:periplasmic heavy metal sensor [Dinghuibacter sp.]
MNKSKVLVAMIVLLLLANAVWVYLYLAKDKGPRRDGRRMFVREQLKKEAGLTDAQATQLEALREKQRKEVAPLLDSMARLRGDLYDLSAKTAADSAVNGQLARIAQLQTAIDAQMLANLHEARKICTAEQLPKFDSIMKRMMMFSGGKRKGPPPPPGNNKH